MATDPDYQRRGAGAALLEKVKAIADEEGLAIYLTSTETGRKLYERCGFQAVKEVVIDLEEMGEVKKGREMFTVSFISIYTHARLRSTVYDTAKRKKSIIEAQFIGTIPIFNTSDLKASNANENTTSHCGFDEKNTSVVTMTTSNGGYWYPSSSKNILMYQDLNYYTWW